MAPTTITALLLLVAFVLPGFITLVINERTHAVPRPMTPFERLLRSLYCSVVIYAVLAPVGWLAGIDRDDVEHFLTKEQSLVELAGGAALALSSCRRSSPPRPGCGRSDGRAPGCSGGFESARRTARRRPGTTSTPDATPPLSGSRSTTGASSVAKNSNKRGSARAPRGLEKRGGWNAIAKRPTPDVASPKATRCRHQRDAAAREQQMSGDDRHVDLVDDAPRDSRLDLGHPPPEAARPAEDRSLTEGHQQPVAKAEPAGAPPKPKD